MHAKSVLFYFCCHQQVYAKNHIPVVCKFICGKTKTETYNQKYVQGISTFDVGVFLNCLRMKL